MAHEPGSSYGRINRNKKCLLAQTNVQPKPKNWSNQVADDYTPRRLPFSSKTKESHRFLVCPVSRAKDRH